jgi:hypothetical protein
VGDKEKLSILNRAESCIPPVEIEIIIENASRKPFFRIEIPSGKDKPYSTSGGTYKIRGNGRTNPLLPSRLLAIFIENEGREFVERFGKATQDLEASLSDVKNKTLEEMNELFQDLAKLEYSLDEVFASASNAEGLADDAMMASGETLGIVQEMDERVFYIDEIMLPHMEMRVNALLDNLGIEDPVVVQKRTVAKSVIADLYGQGYRGRKLLDHAASQVPRASIEELIGWQQEVIREIKAAKRTKSKATC